MYKEIKALEKEVNELETLVGNNNLVVDEDEKEIEKDSIFSRLKSIKTTMRNLFNNQKPLKELLNLCTILCVYTIDN